MQLIDQHQLIDSLIPLYFGRTATYINEVREDTPERAEARVERYAETFHQLKPYLSRRFQESGRARRLHGQSVDGEDWPTGVDTAEFMAIRHPHP
jgi:hypothetical protein